MEEYSHRAGVNLAGANRVQTSPITKDISTIADQINALDPMLSALGECGYCLQKIGDFILGAAPAEAGKASPPAPANEGPLTLRLERRHMQFNEALTFVLEQINRIENRLG